MKLTLKEKQNVRKFLSHAKERKFVDLTAQSGEAQFYYELDDIETEPVLAILSNLLDNQA